MILKPIPDFPGYFASDNGCVYCSNPQNGMNVARKDGKPHPMRRLVGAIFRGERHRYLLRKNSKRYYRSGAYLVLTAFAGLRPTGCFACHGPLGSLNDSIDNVYWATPQQNALDRARDGTQRRGENHPRSILNSLQVRIIRRLYALGKNCSISQRVIGELFGVTQSTIRLIISKRNWKWLS